VDDDGASLEQRVDAEPDQPPIFARIAGPLALAPDTVGTIEVDEGLCLTQHAGRIQLLTLDPLPEPPPDPTPPPGEAL